MKTITILVGSLRRNSYSQKIADNLAPMIPDDYELATFNLGSLPLYNADYDNPEEDYAPLPEEYTAFRDLIKASAGVLFVIPENNRLLPANVKNAIDVGSKPNEDVAWTKTPVGIVSHSVGAMGGYSSQKSLKLALSYFETPITGQPEVFLGKSPQYFTDGDQINNQGTVDFLQSYIDIFIQLVQDNPKD